MTVTQGRDIADQASLQNHATSDQRLFVGTTFAGRYRVDRFIGHGGMSLSSDSLANGSSRRTQTFASAIYQRQKT